MHCCKRFKIVLLFISQLFSVSLFAQYYSGKATDSPGKYRKTFHEHPSIIPASDRTQANAMMAAIVEACKKVYPQPVGVEVGPYGSVWQNYRGNSEFKNGPYTASLTIAFYNLLHTREGGVVPSGEYSSSIIIWINYVKYILDARPVQYGNDYVFRQPLPGIAVNGFPKYNNKLLIIPPGKPLPWRLATKQEYLENFIIGLRNSLPGRSSTPQERQKVTDAEQLLASLSASEKKEIAYLKKIRYSNSDVGYPDFSAYKWSGFQRASDTTAEPLVIIDESFYDKSLPRTSYQVMVIERRNRPASISAAAPTKAEIQAAEDRMTRMNNIVRAKTFLPDIQALMGRVDMDAIAKRQQQQPKDKYVFKKVTPKNISRILDSIYRNYKPNFPVASGTPGGTVSAGVPIDLPGRNNKKLALAARRLNTKEELVSYLNELDDKLSSLLPVSSTTVYADAGKNKAGSYGYWLLNKDRESLLLALKAAKQQPDNNSILNNLGATLGLCGVEYLAVPLYIVCLKKEPGNSTITNNLGQAYLSMGDMQQAQQYLKQAVGATPYHHHANNSLGHIYQSQGNDRAATECYINSLRGSFTLTGYNSLKALHRDSALKLMNYIRHRYKQPDYINFNKHPIPPQCTAANQTVLRKEQHKEYKKVLDAEIIKYERLKNQQKPVAEKSLQEMFVPGQKKRPMLRQFQPFATAMVVSIRHELDTRLKTLEKEIKDIDRSKDSLRLEYEATNAAVDKSFEDRLEKMGEGNPDLGLEEEICTAKETVVNNYLPQFAELNELRFSKTVHVFKNYLNDYLYWIKISSFTPEIYQAEYYDIVLTMYRVLRDLKLTTIDDHCEGRNKASATAKGWEPSEADCPLPIGIEIPFVVGKVSLNCDSWGVDIGEGLVLTIEHKMGVETTVAFGAGESFYTTPKIGSKAFDISPGIDVNAKGQLFITFNGNGISDGGFLWEAEIDIKGLGKPAEIKQNFTWAINKGFNADGVLTNAADKYFQVQETQVNRNVRIYTPQQ